VTRALVTVATGTHLDLLNIARPSFQAFADLHGYDLLEAEPLDCVRPPSWWKVLILQAALRDYDEALWLDADTVIVDGSEDLNVPPDAWQALVEHHTGDGDVPNCGVWLVRQPMAPVLDDLWTMTQYLSHGWWEQAGLHQLMGYRGRPVQLVSPTELYERTHFLDNGWNVHMWDDPQPAHPRIMHATMWKDRVGVMRQWAAAA